MWVFLGATCFVISEPLTRLPILHNLQESTAFIREYNIYPLTIGILIALSAGVFEEGLRFLFKQYLIKPSECDFSQPIIFGLGHGFAEAVLVLVTVFTSEPVPQMGVAVLERALAIILHVSLTVMVWNGFQNKKRALSLLAAVTIHGFADAYIPIFTPFSNSVVLIVGTFALIDILMIRYASYSKKYYIPKRDRDERIKAGVIECFGIDK